MRLTPTGKDATATGSAACPRVSARPARPDPGQPQGRARARDDLPPTLPQPTPSTSGRPPGTTPSCPPSTGPPAHGGGPCCGKTDPSGARNMVRPGSWALGVKLPGARKLGPGGDSGPAPQWSTGTGTGWSHWAGYPTTCPTCQHSSGHATPPRTTGSGTWNPTARPSASGPPLSTRPPSDKDCPSAGTPRLFLGFCPHLGPRALGGQVKKGVSSKSPAAQVQGSHCPPRPGPRQTAKASPRVGGFLFTISSILGAGSRGWAPQPPLQKGSATTLSLRGDPSRAPGPTHPASRNMVPPVVR